MILYENTIKNFLSSMKERNLVDYMIGEYFRRVSRNLSSGTKKEWKITMDILCRLVENARINSQCGIRIDYVVLEKLNRFEVMIAGYNDNNQSKILQLCLLPWEDVKASSRLDFVSYSVDDSENIETLHPSLQSITYKKFICGNKQYLDIQSIIYLYELRKTDDITNVIEAQRDTVEEAPVYYLEDHDKVVKKLKEYKQLERGAELLTVLKATEGSVRKGVEEILQELAKDDTKICMTEEQCLVGLKVLDYVKQSHTSMLFLDGAAGAGKSMTTFFVMSSLIKQGYKSAYISTSNAQSSMLNVKTKHIFGDGMYISGAKSFIEEYKQKPMELDVLFIDEAQNLISNNSKRSVEEQVEELTEIFAKIPVVVVIYSTLQITKSGACGKEIYEEIAIKTSKNIDIITLHGNLRYIASGNGVRWIAHQLQLADTVNFEDWDSDIYKIEMVEHEEELQTKLDELPGNKKILVNKKTSTNLQNVLSVSEVQGMEYDYAGVIVGKEMTYNEKTGKVVVKGGNADDKQVVKNLYYVLFSRAIQGVYIYVVDEKLRKFLGDKLYYASRRFSWIKEMADKYNPKGELDIIDDWDEDGSSVDEIRYRVSAYQAANKFIEDIKECTEDELNEATYKAISDKCSEYLLSLQKDTFKIEEIRKRYENRIIDKMGEGAWNKLSEKGKQCLISAEMTYFDMCDYNSLYDFSSVCLQASKAAEYELCHRFFNMYVKYLEKKMRMSRTDAAFINYVPQKMTKIEKNQKVLMEESDVTLGTIPYITGISGYDQQVKSQYACKSFKAFAEAELLVDNTDPEKVLACHMEYIVKIKDKYRNKAAHKDTMDASEAQDCLNYVIEVEKTLAEMLDAYKL